MVTRTTMHRLMQTCSGNTLIAKLTRYSRSHLVFSADVTVYHLVALELHRVKTCFVHALVQLGQIVQGTRRTRASQHVPVHCLHIREYIWIIIEYMRSLIDVVQISGSPGCIRCRPFLIAMHSTV